MKRTGSCQWGNIQYEVEGDSLASGICYCTECQKLSTGLATYGMVLKRASFRVTKGALKQWERSSYNGNRNVAHFCPDCGGRIFHENPDLPDIIRLKAGTLANASDLVPDVHVWLRSAPPWVQIPEGAIAYETQPSFPELITLVAEKRGDAKNTDY